MYFSLRQLEVFVAVAQHGTVSRAAEMLAMSQSAASTAIGELERQFDVQLFDRIGRSLHINAVGRDLLPRAAELLDRAGEIETVLGRKSVFGDLKVGATLTIGNYLATLVVAEFLQRHPDSRVALTVRNASQVMEQVAAFELDLGLVEGDCQDPDLEVAHWVDDELVPFATPEHPLARRGSARWEELAECPWILREKGSGTRGLFDAAVASLPGRVQVRLELEHTEAIKRSVESGLGLGCISRLALREAFRRGSLAPIDCPELNLRRPFNFVWRKQKFQTVAMKEFIALCHRFTAGALRSDQIPLPFIP